LAGLYDILRTIHNAVGGITLVLTLAAAGVLLATARTTTTLSSSLVRANVISASLQFVLGVLLIVVGFVIGIGAALGGLWLHILLGIASVGVISSVAARARRAPDAEARRYGLMLLGVLVLVLVTFLIGQFAWNPLA
jgi:Ca2+/Na+ antiporter